MLIKIHYTTGFNLVYHEENIKYQLLCLELSCRLCVVLCKFRCGYESRISWKEFGSVHNRGVNLNCLMEVFVSLLLQWKCRRATITIGTKVATTATHHTPATARHGAVPATHTTSRTTANVGYHFWQHRHWLYATVWRPFFITFHKSISRMCTLDTSHHIFL